MIKLPSNEGSLSGREQSCQKVQEISGLGASGRAEILLYQVAVQGLVWLIDGIIRLLMKIKNNSVTIMGFFKKFFIYSAHPEASQQLCLPS